MASEKKLLAVIAALIAAALLIVAAFLGVALYTSVPFHVAAHYLAKLGVDIEGVSGSVATGLRVEHLSFGGPENSFTLEQFSLKHDGLWQYFVKHELNISEVSVGRLVIKLKMRTTGSVAGGTAATQAAPAAAAGGSGGRHVHIAKIDVGTVVLDLSDQMTPFEINNWQVRNLTAVGGKLDFDSFEVKSNAIDLALVHGPAVAGMKETATSTDRAIKLVLKPTYIKQLKAPVSFEGRMRLDDGVFDKSVFFLSAFDGKASLKFGNANADNTRLLTLQIADLALSDYLTGPLPVQRVSVNATLGPDVADLTTLQINQGEFTVGTGKLIVAPGPVIRKGDGGEAQFHLGAVAENAGVQILAQLTGAVPKHYSSNDPKSPTNPSIGETLKIELSSTPSLPDDELLSKLMFSKSFAALTEAEKTQLAADKAHFAFKAR